MPIQNSNRPAQAIGGKYFQEIRKTFTKLLIFLRLNKAMMVVCFIAVFLNILPQATQWGR